MVKTKIRLLLLCWICFFILVVNSYCSEKKFPYIGVVVSEKLRVLPARGTNYREITTLSQNDLVTVLDKNGEWLHVSMPDDVSCWMSSDYIDDEGVVTGNAVNVRQGPGVANPVLGQVSKSDKLTVLEKKGSWCRISPPDSLKAWINSNFVSYFSDVDNVDAQIRRLEESSRLFNEATLHSKTQLLKSSYHEIDFSGMREKYYELIREYTETIHAKKALFQLSHINEEEKRLEAKILEEKRVKKLKELFDIADNFARKELDKRDVNDIKLGQIMVHYFSVIKEYPNSEEAKWSIDRIIMAKNKIANAAEEQKKKRLAKFKLAEEFRSKELLKDFDSIDYDIIVAKYRKIIVLYPNTPEASRAKSRIDDIRQRKSMLKLKKTDSKEDLYGSYSGVLMQETADLYRIEERSLFSKKDICCFKSDDPNIKFYSNKKVKVYGVFKSFDSKKRPVIDLTKIELIN